MIIGKLFVVTQNVEWWTTLPNRRSSEYRTFGMVEPGDILLCIDYEPQSFILFVSSKEGGQILNMPLAVLDRTPWHGDPITWQETVALLLNHQKPTMSSWKRKYIYKFFRDFLKELEI